jgi:hypothetical protein
VAHCAEREDTERDMQVEDESTPLKPTRASFVRGLPETMPLEEVIERGREAGIQLNPSDVHSARYYMRQEALAQLSARPSAPPQLVQATPVARVTPGKPKAEVKATSMLGLRAPSAPSSAHATSAARGGKKSVEVKSRRGRASAPAAVPVPAPAPAKRAKAAPKLDGSLEEQLRQIVMRIGTERARRIIEQIEDLQV